MPNFFLQWGYNHIRQKEGVRFARNKYTLFEKLKNMISKVGYRQTSIQVKLIVDFGQNWRLGMNK